MNKHISNAYLVLSVGDIREMLLAGELEKKYRGSNKDSVTLVLTDIEVNDGEQIASWSVNKAVRRAAEETKRHLDKTKV